MRQPDDIDDMPMPDCPTEIRSRIQEPIKAITKAEWMAEGTRRFGPDTNGWRFVCPSCGNVAAIIDFKPYADRGSHPNSATCECIGRYTGAKDAFTEGVKPCNYAGYGLFRFSPVIVRDGDIEVHSFAFAEVA